jgi:hypothetical protein
MTPTALLLQRLQAATRSGRIGDLIGDGWDTYWRILHPGERRDHGDYASVSWAEVARTRGVALDPALSSWREVAGVEPHTNDLPPGVDLEPTEGADDHALHWLLLDTLVRSAGDQTVALAEWAGYGDATPVVGALEARIAREPYRILTVERGQLPVRAGFRVNYAIGDSGLWLVGADIDLMSTYVGTAGTLRINWPTSFEVAVCSADDRLS